MYYNRKISDSFSQLIEKGGELRWLFDFVNNHKELDFLIGRNNAIEWISIYRGLTRILSIQPTNNPQKIKLNASNTYKKISAGLYGEKWVTDNFQKDLENIIAQIGSKKYFDRYYKNRKEGYYQNELSRIYGICGSASDDFVIIDKEVVIGYSNQKEKDEIFGVVQNKYKQLQKEISVLDPKQYGRNLEKKAIGNELDFLALDKVGNILLIEYKHGTSTSGIYLSPLQIGLYNDIFTNFPKRDLESAVFEMLDQKQKIGLLNPNWPKPNAIKEIIPVLIISEYNYRSSARIKFDKILKFTKERLGSGFLNELQTFNFTLKSGLSKW